MTERPGVTEQHRDPERQVLRLGSVLAVVGGLGYFATLLLHGDLPDHTTDAALEHIAGRPEWTALKLMLTVFVLLWVGAFTALADSLPAGMVRLLGRMALTCVMIGAAIVVIQYAIMGYGLKQAADGWALATGEEEQSALWVGAALLAVTGGMFPSFIAWLFGLPFVLMGWAVARSRAYPRWLGWWAVLAGAGALTAGTTRFLGLEVVPFPLLYGGFVVPLCFWLATVGAFMWRRSTALEKSSP